MRKIIEMKHHYDDYECMWNGIEDIYINKTGECLPDNFFFGLAGTGSFCYLKTPKGDLKRMIALGDGRTKKMYEFLAPIVGFEFKHYQYSSFDKAMKKAKSEINAGYPVVLGALDMFYLPYFTKLYQNEHIPFHYVLMVGYDDENESIFLYDCGRTELISLSYDNLSKAMDCSYPGLSKENTVCTIRMDEPKDMLSIAREAFATRKKSFLNPPVNIIGYKGFEKFIKELPTLRDEIGKQEYDRILINMVEFMGTVPTIPNAIKGINEPDTVIFDGGFSKIIKVLRFLGDKTKEESWYNSANIFEKGSAIIMQISNIIIKYITGKEDETNMLSNLFKRVLEVYVEGYKALNV